MEVTDDTASSLRVATAVDGFEKTGAITEKGAGEASVFFTIPLTTTETPRLASTSSHEDMDSLQKPTAMNEGTQNEARSTTQDVSIRQTLPSELRANHGPTEVVRNGLPLVNGVQQRQRSSSLPVTPTDHLALTEPSSFKALAGAGNICPGTVQTVNSHPSALKGPLDSVIPKEPPRKKKRNYRKKQHTLEPEDHRGAVTAASPKSNRSGGRHKFTTKQTGALNVDEARCAADTQLAQVDRTQVGSSEDAIALHQASNMSLKEFNRRIPVAGEQALSGAITHVSRSAARWKTRPLRGDGRHKGHTPEAFLDRKIPDDAGSVRTGSLNDRVHETPSQPGVSTLGEAQHPVLRSETGLLSTSDNEHNQALQMQVLEEKKACLHRQNSAPLLSSIDETAFSQTSSTSRTFIQDLSGRSKTSIMQPYSKTKAGDNLTNNGVGPGKNPLSSNTRQPTASESIRRVLIPRSRYKVRRVPIHTKENPPRDGFDNVQEGPSSLVLTNMPILAFSANKDVVELPIVVTAGKVLAETEGDSGNIKSSAGKLTPSQKNRLKLRRKKEQARATAGSGLGSSMQSGLAQAQPNYSPQPHTTEEPSQLITIPNTNITMNQTHSPNGRQPISTIGQIQNLLRGMNSDYRKPSRSSSMGRSRGSRSARGRANASDDTSPTGLNPTPSAFGHQIVERRQRGYQPQGTPTAVHHVSKGLLQSHPHQRERGEAAVEGSPAVALSIPAVQIVTMNATIPEADPVHIKEALGASKNQSLGDAKDKAAADASTRATTSVHRSITSATLVASPPAVASDWDTPRGSPEQLDWSKSISPNSFSFNNLPRWSLQPTFSSRERTNLIVPPQPALSRVLKDTGVPVTAKSVSVQATVVKKPTLKENENPSVHPKKAESRNPPLSPGKYDGNGVFIPPHLRPPTPLKRLVDVPADVALKIVLAEFEEEDAHLPPHLRRPARKSKPLKASPVSFVAAATSPGALSGAIGYLGNQEQHSLSHKPEQGCVATPPKPRLGLHHSTNTHMAVTAPREKLPVRSVLPPVPERALGQSKAFDNIKPSRKVREQDSNAGKSASIDSNVAVNDGETRPKTKLQYEPQLHDWEGNWAPAPVEWDARPSFDNTDSRHMRAMEGWMDERAEAALREPIQIDIRDPKFLDGGKPAGGLENLDSPVEDEVSETLLPNDPFTHTRIHQTAEASALAYHKKAYKEKKLSKEDRKAYKVAAKLQNDSYVPPPNPHVPKANIYIRPAIGSDMRQITQIYNHYVRNSVVASERDDLTEAQWQVRWRSSTAENFAFLVAVLKSGNRGGRFRRDNVETIVGFAYAEDFSESGNMYRFTCELQFWVHHQHLRHGIGKTLIDRMLPALDNGYYCRQGTDFVADNPIEYEGGGLRTIARILVSIPYDATDAKEFTWQKKWLSQWDFEQVGNMPGIGRKFEKDIDVAHLMKITSVIVPRAS